MDWGVVALSLVPAVLTFLGSMLMFRPQRNKMRADAAGVLVGAGMDMVDRLEEHIARLENQVDQQEEEIANLKSRVHKLEKERGELLNGIERLIAQIAELNQRPVWIPVEAAVDTGNKPERGGLSQPLGRGH